VLILIFGLAPGSLVVLLWYLLGLPPAELVAVSLLAYLCSAVYIQSYPAFQEDIPSFRILALIRGAGDRGIEEEEVIGALEGTSLFTSKASDLIDEGMIRIEPNQVILTPSGEKVTHLFSYLRKWLGIKDGDG
jgi:hypothetical protein